MPRGIPGSGPFAKKNKTSKKVTKTTKAGAARKASVKPTRKPTKKNVVN